MTDPKILKKIEEYFGVPFEELKSRTSLDLVEINISDFSFLKEFKHLTSLDLRYNQLSDVSFLRELKSLTSLVLTGNQLSDVSVLEELKSLTSLTLRNSGLSDVSFLKGHSRLLFLDLGFNKVTDVSFLKELKRLSSLDLSGNPGINDYYFLKELKSLLSLFLAGNNLSDISFLKELKNLTSLNLNNNELLHVSFLKELKSLKSLRLINNKISDVSFLKELKNLERLDLSNNKIKTLPDWIVELQMEIIYESPGSGIILSNNPLETPPVEIVKQGKAAIRKYFQDLKAKGMDYIFEAKLLILGEPGAGKTTLARKIRDFQADLPAEKETTRGIDVDPWIFPYIRQDQKIKITANIWDFGGQAIYKATHRFFLTRRSLYAIVADARKENTDFYYWLHTVELFGEESPVLIVINEKENRKRDIPYKDLRGRFTVLKDKIEVNFKEPDKKLERLVDTLKHEISHLHHIGDPIPANWKQIREHIRELERTRKTIRLDEYRSLCEAHGLNTRQDQEIVCEFFHDLGVFLHYKDNDVLQHAIFLNKEWILTGVYRILDDNMLVQKQGRFIRNDIEKIFTDEYADYISQLIALMKKFYLVYEKDNFLIAPQLLPYDAPEYAWDDTENIQFQFEYEIFMPSGILWQFIVEMKDEIKGDWVWRYGVVLDFGDTVAKVIEHHERRQIAIRVRGPRREDIRAVILRKIEEINRQFKKLKVKKRVPCVCPECKISSAPFLFDYEKVIAAKNVQVSELQCQDSFRGVPVSRLLSGIEFLEREAAPREPQRNESPMINIHNEIHSQDISNKKPPLSSRTWWIVLGAVGIIIVTIISLLTGFLKNFSAIQAGWIAFKKFLGLE